MHKMFLESEYYAEGMDAGPLLSPLKIMSPLSPLKISWN